MMIDARGIDPGTEIGADLCIVGAGAAGVTLARSLARENIRICLLESGGDAYDKETNSLYRAQNLGHPYWRLDECQFRAFGGNTNCWGGWCRPFDEIDFRDRAWVQYSGWPFPCSELLPYYRPAHEICQIPSDSYRAAETVAELSDERAQLLPVDPEKLESTIFRFSPPTRFRHVYFDDVRRSGSITCLLHANAINIEASHDGGAVSWIDAGCRDGNRFRVRAAVYVLAAGGTENPRLLLNSRNQMACGLGNAEDLVGRFFMEHPHTKRRIIAPSRPVPVALYGLHYHGRGVSARLSLTPAIQEREGLLNYSANIHPVYRGCGGEGWLALRKIVLAVSPSRRGDPFLRMPPYGPKRVTFGDVLQIVRTLPQTTIGGFLQLYRPNFLIKGYLLESKSEQSPNPDSRILLQQDRDPFGLQRIALDWRTQPLDRHTVIRGEEIIEEELRRLNIGTLEPLTAEEKIGWPGSGLEGGWHQLGTTRMSDDPRRGVVDRHGRVHGMANLYMTGGSVFPTVGAGPPTLTIVALALRLADRLRRAPALSAVRASGPGDPFLDFLQGASRLPLTAARSMSRA